MSTVEDEDFFRDIDRSWKTSSSGEKIPLRIIGATALMLRASYVRGTKDSDVVRTSDLTDDVAERLIEGAGPDTPLHKRHRLYLQLVSCFREAVDFTMDAARPHSRSLSRPRPLEGPLRGTPRPCAAEPYEDAGIPIEFGVSGYYARTP